MNETIPEANTSPISVSPVGENKPEIKTNSLNNTQAKIQMALKRGWQILSESKFYKNKKVFWPITIGFGLILLTLIIGLLFGNRNRGTKPTNNIPTPTPESRNEIVEENGSVLSQIEKNLKDLKTQITGFDTQQSRLKPPPLNFKVKF